MKKTVNAAIGGCSFTIDDDAYNYLNDYLERFRTSLEGTVSSSEVMDELEARIADLLKGRLGGREVVDIAMTEAVIGQLGYLDNAPTPHGEEKCEEPEEPVKKLYRNPDDKRIGGVCSGLAAFFDIDVVLIRATFLVGLFCGSAGFWVYLAIWIAAPEAKTATEKCQMRGISPTADNIRKFTEGQ